VGPAATGVQAARFPRTADATRHHRAHSRVHPGCLWRGGFTNLNNELEAKRLKILSELAPSATTIAVVLDSSLVPVEGKLGELEPAARRLGRQLRVLKAGNRRKQTVCSV
jgi:hypothetical protein